MKHPILLMVAALLAGCERHSTPMTPPAPPPPAAAAEENSPLPARLEAATRIMSSEARNDALGKVARDAANAGNGAVTKQALERISILDAKDRAAADCALAFAKRKEIKTAGEIAQLISSTETRDKTLSAIAKSP